MSIAEMAEFIKRGLHRDEVLRLLEKNHAPAWWNEVVLRLENENYHTEAEMVRSLLRLKQ